MEGTIEGVAQSVAALTDAVAQMREGLVDRETVERIAEEVALRQKGATHNPQSRGFEPSEDDEKAVLGATGAQRLVELHQRSATAVAPLVRASADDVAYFQRKSDELTLLSTALKCDPRETEFYTEQYLPALRAVNTKNTGQGKEFVPIGLSANITDRVRLGLKVAALFRSVEMPTNPFDIPGRGPRVKSTSMPENVADPIASNVPVQKVTPQARVVRLAAVKLAVEALVSKEAQEDSLIPILQFIEDELVESLAYDWEDGIINGKVSPALDSDVSATNDPRRAFDGLRSLVNASAKTDGGGGKLTVAMLRTNRSKMGVYGVNPLGLAHIISPRSFIGLLDDPNVITMDKIGNKATILQGQLASVDGIPVVVAEAMREDLPANGLYTAAGATKSTALTVNTGAFITGERRGVTTQLLTELYAEVDQNAILATLRRAFGNIFAASENVVAQTTNVG